MKKRMIWSVALVAMLLLTLAAPLAMAQTEAPAEPGLVIVNVDAAGPAAKAGVKRGDILLAAEKLFAQHGYHAVSLRQILILEADAAAGYPSVAPQKLDNRLAGDAFPAARLTDDADEFARLNLKAHAAHRVNLTLAGAERGLQVLKR